MTNKKLNYLFKNNYEVLDSGYCSCRNDFCEKVKEEKHKYQNKGYKYVEVCRVKSDTKGLICYFVYGKKEER